MSEFDTLLYRPLQSGKKYEGLLPDSRCDRTALGDGLTDFSIKQMKILIDQFDWQTEFLARALQGDTFEQSLSNIKDFIYNHFQYKADAEEQMLRTPACSWASRTDGIDCKSYSILASCLLQNMGISHYLRKIKQPGFAPDEWTHVYVVVPIDQKSNDLQKGYFTIDGTLEEDQEPAFIETSDLLMRHTMLNGPWDQVKGEIDGFDFKKLFNLKDISFNNIKDIIANTCPGGSSYPKSEVEGQLNLIQNFFQEIIVRINAAVVQANTDAFSTAVMEFSAYASLLVTASERNKQQGWNDCTTKSINANIAAYQFYRDVATTALFAWVNQNFDITNSFTIPNPARFPNRKEYDAPIVVFVANSAMEARFGFKHIDSGRIVNAAKLTYVTKPSVQEIKAFELTPYVANTSDATAFNATQYLGTLSQVIATFAPAGNNPINPATGQPYQNFGDNNEIETQQAGMGAMGWVLLAGAAYGAISLFTAAKQSKGQPAKTTKK